MLFIACIVFANFCHFAVGQATATSCTKEGDTVVDGSFWFTCIKVNDTLNLQLAGCVGDSSEKVESGKTFKSGAFVFKCIKTPTEGITVEPVACLHNGTEIAVGSDFSDDSFFYTCSKEGDSGVRRHLSGCVNLGKKVEMGGKYRKDGFILKCEKMDNGIRQAVVGCTSEETDKEFAMGERWTEGKAPFRYTVECAKNGEGVMKKITQCVYESKEGNATLDPGCQKKVGANFVQCFQKGENGLEFQVANQASDKLKQC